MIHTKNIETLIILLVVALAIQFLGSKGVFFYFLHSGEAVANGRLEIHAFALTLKYQNFAGNALALLVTFVIGYWLCVTATSRKLLWAAFGLLAKWWALPIFAYYIYLQSNDNT